MVEDDRPTIPPEVSPLNDGDPFGALSPGTQIGKYEIVELLGKGGFGITYRAHDTQLHRDVALKEYLPTSFARRQNATTVIPRSTETAEDFLWGRERFLDEARTLARLEDAPGIVNVHDFLEANGTAYMVMTLVRGDTLEARLKRDRRLQQPALEQLLYPLLDGLELVHDAGFLHRDIKPANILIDASGRPTLIDFGASRVALHGRTQVMTAIYTPGYAAPEQMTSARQGPWTDIYALAGTLYHCVAGRTPPSAMERVTGDAFVPATEAGKGRYAPSLLAAIDEGLKLQAAERPQTIAAWRAVLAGQSPTMGETPTGPATRVIDKTATRRVAGGDRRRLPLAWVAAGLIALAVAGGGGWLMLRPQPETAEQALRRAEAEAQRQAEVIAKLRQEEEARQRAAAEAARKADPAAARKADEEKEAAEAAARRQTEEAERQRIAAEAARRQAEEDAARKAAEERQAAEAAARRKAEEEEAARVAAETARRRAEEQARAEAEANLKAEQEAAARKAEQEAAARKAAEEEVRIKAEAEAAARQREDDIRRAAEEEVRAEIAARERADAEARARAEEDARKAAEDKAKADADARRQAEAGEAALRLGEQDRKRAQVALTAVGHDTRGTDGTFGPHTRQMIAAWQKKQGAPETGYLTAPQFTALRQQAAPALAKYDDEQKRLEDEKRKAEDEAKRRQEEDARRRAQQPASPPPQVATSQPAPAAPAPAPAGSGVARFNGNYVGQFCQPAHGTFPGFCWPATVVVSNGALSGGFMSQRTGTPTSWRGSVGATGAVDMQYDSVSSQINPGAPAPARLRGTINGTVMELAGRWTLVDRALTGRFQRAN